MWLPILPPFSTCLWAAPALLAFVCAVGFLCGLLKRVGRARTGDTRKLFHFAILSAAAVLSGAWGLAGVNLLGGLVTAYVLLVLWRGEGSLVFEALARESDAPRRSLLVALPLAATAMGGVLATSLFGAFSTVGFAVSGCADALAEPVGIRWGRHRYRTPGFGSGVPSTRSLEGSLTVLVAGTVAAAIALALTGGAYPGGLLRQVGVPLAVGTAGAIVEAVSPHGLDNLTLQLAASGTAWALA